MALTVPESTFAYSQYLHSLPVGSTATDSASRTSIDPNPISIQANYILDTFQSSMKYIESHTTDRIGNAKGILRRRSQCNVPDNESALCYKYLTRMCGHVHMPAYCRRTAMISVAVLAGLLSLGAPVGVTSRLIVFFTRYTPRGLDKKGYADNKGEMEDLRRARSWRAPPNIEKACEEREEDTWTAPKDPLRCFPLPTPFCCGDNRHHAMPMTKKHFNALARAIQSNRV
ncbi:hypothetical protein PCH_Pc18g03950 [Penicillium rubens Wisconsin 54-1255]|uniref:Uncharacterized protein n=1 Tax=Penicillium rubens (strain ATCC 28089 / DSM 1075 / NRRL 1951 / Wisconsin 54-1255) TaxID=500485 RepID=B6HBF9_PENRW|nr:hypothetical protein PCH_Pc18g03950 [Penicillium rubens Wisconsin 54-1255]